MIDNDLTRIFQEEGADKYHRHRYDVPYHYLFERMRNTATSVFEIGVYKGQSLKSWRRYFPQAQIVGMDLKPRPKELPQEILHYQGDQGDRELLDRIAKQHGPFDLIIEDGSHTMKHQKQCAVWLWPHVKVGGVYVCEDLHTSELIERPGDEGGTFAARFNPDDEAQTAREWFLDDARQRCIRRGDNKTRLGDRLVLWSTAMCAWVKVHDVV